MIAVHLTLTEYAVGVMEGILRQASAEGGQLRNAHAFNGDDVSLHIQGALAELAVAKATNRFWGSTLRTEMHGGDVSGWEVRSSPRHDASLILHPSDSPERVFILITGANHDWCVRGWMYAHERRDEWWRTDVRAPAWFVPQSALHPFAKR